MEPKFITLKVQSLQIAVFLLTVCHVVVVVQDNVADVGLWNLLRTAEMIKVCVNFSVVLYNRNEFLMFLPSRHLIQLAKSTQLILVFSLNLQNNIYSACV